MDGRREDLLSPGALAAFTLAVALSAIFVDAALGHGLTWENDPYWTYWVTKTFLIATIFGLGTAWFGVGIGRGAMITAVHTLVLTIYYWTLSPIGLPSQPTWLDLEHTWITGVPIHFGVIGETTIDAIGDGVVVAHDRHPSGPIRNEEGATDKSDGQGIDVQGKHPGPPRPSGSTT